jgi:hypothetical protein
MSIVVYGKIGLTISFKGMVVSTAILRLILTFIHIRDLSSWNNLIPYPQLSGGNLSEFKGSNAFSLRLCLLENFL